MWDRNIRKSRRRDRVRAEINRQRNLVDVVEIEELFGRRRRAVRLVESDGEKERLVFVFAEKINGAIGNHVIAE